MAIMEASSAEAMSPGFFQWLLHILAQVGNALGSAFNAIWHAIASGLSHIGLAIASVFRKLGLSRLVNAMMVLGHAIVVGLAFLLAVAMAVMMVTFLLMATATCISYARSKARQRASIRIRLTMASMPPEEPLLRHPPAPRVPHWPAPASQSAPHTSAPDSSWMRAVREVRTEAERRRRSSRHHAGRFDQLGARWAPQNTFLHTFLSLHERAYGDAEDCIICLDPLAEGDKSIGKLHCGHVFHMDCIASWFASRDELSCPVCRQVYSDEVTEYTPVYVTYGTESTLR